MGAPLESQRALVVDDSPVARKILRRLLEDLGVQVTEAEHGQRGIEQAEQCAFDLIVADLSMPQLDGVEMIAELRKQRTHEHTPVIVTTATWADDHAAALAGVNVSAWILKPVDGQLFKRAVTRMLEQRLAGRAQPGVSPLRSELGALAEPQRPRVLVVDDEPHVIDGLRRKLFDTYDVVGCSSGEEALSMITRQNYPVALVDLAMPGMHGIALLERMRTAAPNTVRLVHTGQYNLVQALAAINQGSVFRFLTKPCETPVLENALQAALEQHRLETSDRSLIEARVQELSAQLVRAERLASLGTMAAAVGHEIGNLAAALVSLEEGMRADRNANRPVNEDDLALLSMAHAHLKKHAAHLRHLGLPGIEQDTLIDVATVCGETINLLSQLGVLHGVRVSVALPTDPVTVSIDRTRLEQVVINLLKNAVEALADTGDTRAIQVEVARDLETGMAVVRVTDNGCGIPKAALPKVFDAYFSTKGDRGTGLGLPVIKQVVEQRGGTITCQSSLGEGTTFELRLPLRVASRAAG